MPNNDTKGDLLKTLKTYQLTQFHNCMTGFSIIFYCNKLKEQYNRLHSLSAHNKKIPETVVSLSENMIHYNTNMSSVVSKNLHLFPRVMYHVSDIIILHYVIKCGCKSSCSITRKK